MQPQVGVVIINWNAFQDTRDCLESLLRVDYTPLHIIIVDNASTDNSLSALRNFIATTDAPCSEFSDVGTISCSGEKHISILALQENTGFCGGNNLGMKHSFLNGAEFSIVLNNDTVVDREFVRRLVQAAHGEPELGLMGCQIRYHEDPSLVWWAGGSFDRWYQTKRVGDRTSVEQLNLTGITKTDWISGCMTMVPRATYERFGGFDESLFIWAEEWDISIRVARAGLKLLVAQDAVVYHKVGRSLGRFSSLSYYYGTRNQLILAHRYLMRLNWFMYLIWYTPNRMLRWTQLIIMGRADLTKAGLCAFYDFARGRTGQWQVQR